VFLPIFPDQVPLSEVFTSAAFALALEAVALLALALLALLLPPLPPPVKSRPAQAAIENPVIATMAIIAKRLRRLAATRRVALSFACAKLTARLFKFFIKTLLINQNRANPYRLAYPPAYSQNAYKKRSIILSKEYRPFQPEAPEKTLIYLEKSY
jgi:hypothetical protein